MSLAFCRRITAILVIGCMALPALAAVPLFNGDGQQLPSLAPMLKDVNPTVVNIATYTNRTVRQNPLLNDPFFRRFFNVPEGHQQPRTRRTQSAGSGVIIDASEGTVVTNHHVVDGADEIVVSLADGRTYQAKLVGSDPDVDIAVLKLEKFNNLTAVIFADSDNLSVGDFVIAIGNPFGLGQTVTSGIVSALGRSGLGIEDYENFIQTDASINPGNSGGALVNLRGELVGINTAIIAPAGGNVGIGFAIPTNMAKSSIDQILEYGEVKRGQLGVIIQDLTRELADAFDIDEQQRGVVIAEVQPDSAAEKAGLKAGDVVISVDAKAVQSTAQLRSEIGRRRIGEKIKLTILREGRSKVIKVKIGEPLIQTASSAAIHKFLEGAVLKESKDGRGIDITNVERDSVAQSSGLRQGDVILSANRYRVENLADLKKAAGQSEERLVLRIKRGNAALFLVLQ
jgi:Do/DeqQ family serine protease